MEDETDNAPEGVAEDVQPVETQEDPRAKNYARSAEIEEQALQTPTPERDEKGRFVPKDGPIMVPLQALHETRDEVKALRAQLSQMQAPPPPPVPDQFAEPEAYEAYKDSVQNQKLVNIKLDLSEDMAREKHGDEKVNEVQQWALQQFQANPAFRDTVLSQRNPYGFAISEYDKQNKLSQIGDADFNEFLAWKQSRAQKAVPPNPPRPVSGVSSGAVLKNAGEMSMSEYIAARKAGQI